MGAVDPYFVLLAVAFVGAVFAERRRRRRARRRSVDELVFPAEGFFAAPDAAVDEMLVERGPAGAFVGVDAKLMTPAVVARLGHILVAGEFEALVEEASATARRSTRGDAGVFRLPTAMRDFLASADVASTAERWSDTEELLRAGWTYADARAVVARLRRLAAAARDDGTSIWVWWSAR